MKERILFVGTIVLLIGVYLMTTSKIKSLSEVTSWGYQLQGTGGEPLVLSELIKLPYNLLVTDYSKTGMAQDEWKPEEIKAIKNSGKIVLSYFSIGEAEEVRFYYKNLDKTLVEKENPAWKGNYKAFYWMEGWQKIMFQYLDRIIDQGFDGVYLDIIDAYYYFGAKDNGGNGVNPNAGVDMIDFIAKIAHHAKVIRKKEKFLVFPQNAPALWTSESFPTDIQNDPEKLNTIQEKYFNNIDAIGMESVFFLGNSEQDNPYNPQSYVLGLLKEYQKRGKPIFSVEYISKEEYVQKYFSVAAPLGFISLTSDRSLDGTKVRSP